MIELQGDKIRTFCIATLAVLTMLGTSCTANALVSGGGDAEAVSVAPGAETEPVAEERESPLDTALFGSSDAYEEIRLASELLIEDSIARCMAQQGFEYVPQKSEDLLTVRYFPSPEVDGWNIVNSVRNDLVDFNNTERGRQLQWDAPDSFTESQVSEWDAAMFGDGRDGCVPSAYYKAPSIDEITWNDAWLQQGYAEIGERTDSDPRVAQANADTERCLNDQGLSSAKVQQKQDQLNLEMEPVYEFMSTTTEQPSWADIPDSLRKIMDRVLEEEIMYATISASCKEVYNAVAGQVSTEYEAEWVKENELRLAELAAKIDEDVHKSLSRYLDN